MFFGEDFLQIPAVVDDHSWIGREAEFLEKAVHLRPEVAVSDRVFFGGDDENVVVGCRARAPIRVEILFLFVVATGVGTIKDDHFHVGAGFADGFAEAAQFLAFALGQVVE